MGEMPPHVKAMIAAVQTASRAVQPKREGLPGLNRVPAPHVQAAIRATQAKMGAKASGQGAHRGSAQAKPVPRPVIQPMLVAPGGAGGGAGPSGQGWRASKPLAPKAMENAVIEGHGEIENPAPTFKVPDSNIIVIFQGMGAGLDDSHGMDIASGKGTQVQMPLLWDAHNAEYDTEPPASGGGKVAGAGIRKYYYPGNDCPDLKLFPWNHPAMGVLNVQAVSYRINYDPGNPHHFERLSTIANRLPGTMILWAACTVYR